MSNVGWKFCAAFLLLAGAGAAPAQAFLQVDDFEAAPSGGFNNPFFNHNVQPDEYTGTGPAHEFAEDERDGGTGAYSFYLFPGTDYVTFNLPQDGYVDYAEVWIKAECDVTGPSFFHVLGEDANGSPIDWRDWPDVGETWMRLDTSQAGFALITEIRLTALKEAKFDDLTVHYVPEPATLGLMAVGFAGLIFSRRSRRGR